MATDPEFLGHVRDLFADLGEISTGRMFSGTSLYLDGDVMFAAILGGTVWMKSDESTRAAFEAAGSQAFSYSRKTGTRLVPSLMSLPDAALDDPEEALRWARMSLPPARDAALKKRQQKARKAAKA